jgi:hypothetical protein
MRGSPIEAKSAGRCSFPGQRAHKLPSDVPETSALLRAGTLVAQAAETGRDEDVQRTTDELLRAVELEGWMTRVRLYDLGTTPEPVPTSLAVTPSDPAERRGSLSGRARRAITCTSEPEGLELCTATFVPDGSTGYTTAVSCGDVVRRVV